jgi:hypothetical protein
MRMFSQVVVTAVMVITLIAVAPTRAEDCLPFGANSVGTLSGYLRVALNHICWPPDFVMKSNDYAVTLDWKRTLASCGHESDEQPIVLDLDKPICLVNKIGGQYNLNSVLVGWPTDLELLNAAKWREHYTFTGKFYEEANGACTFPVGLLGHTSSYQYHPSPALSAQPSVPSGPNSFHLSEHPAHDAATAAPASGPPE